MKTRIVAVLLVCLLLVLAAPASAQSGFVVDGNYACAMMYDGGYPYYACVPILGTGYEFIPYVFISTLWYYLTWMI